MASTTKPKAKKPVTDKPKASIHNYKVEFYESFVTDKSKTMSAHSLVELRGKIIKTMLKPNMARYDYASIHDSDYDPHVSSKSYGSILKETVKNADVGKVAVFMWLTHSDTTGNRRYALNTDGSLGNRLPVPQTVTKPKSKKPVAARPKTSKSKSIKATLIFDPMYNTGKWKHGDKDYVEADDYDELRRIISLKYTGFISKVDWIHVYIGGKQVATVQLARMNEHLWWPKGDTGKWYNPYSGRIKGVA